MRKISRAKRIPFPGSISYKEEDIGTIAPWSGCLTWNGSRTCVGVGVTVGVDVEKSNSDSAMLR